METDNGKGMWGCLDGDDSMIKNKKLSNLVLVSCQFMGIVY